MDNEYAKLRKEAKEIFELFICCCWSDADKKIRGLYPKYPDDHEFPEYISELLEILKRMKVGVQPMDYLTQRKNEMTGKKIKGIWDALTDFQVYVDKPRTEFK